ncbi:hypothetical protein D9619_009639 [Psilocybe cf. subviscida]|uniref:Uncharacterized protein n=1 Tax=Psilocybe cf. subviscida TaxID=2480587 RepID=A0A8H5BLC6_9AGAR|nr:hypothetical protein D9619_009639 [Psilocybe cf. subviscida]
MTSSYVSTSPPTSSKASDACSRRTKAPFGGYAKELVPDFGYAPSTLVRLFFLVPADSDSTLQNRVTITICMYYNDYMHATRQLSRLRPSTISGLIAAVPFYNLTVSLPTLPRSLLSYLTPTQPPPPLPLARRTLSPAHKIPDNTAPRTHGTISGGALSQVSPHLQDASETKSLWTGLFLQESKAKSNTPRSVRLELPMSVFCSSEVEHILLRWKSSRSAWRRGKVQMRNIVHRPIAHAMVHLLKGSSICEAINIAAPVFSSLALGDGTTAAVMSDQEIDGSPVLAARVAALYSVAKKITPPRPKWNRAAKLASFPLPSGSQNPCERSVTSLDNESASYISYALAPHAAVFLTVIDWSKPDERSTSYPRRYVAGPTAKDAKKQGILVRNSLIFTRYRNALILISYAHSQETNAFPHRDCADGKRMWQGCAGLFADQASAPFLCTTSTRIAIQCHREIMGIIMKHDQTEGIEVVQLTSLPSPNLLDQSHLRYHHAISYPDRTDAPAVALSFCWPDKKGDDVSVPFTAQHKILPQSALHRTALCGEHYFRVLFDGENTNAIRSNRLSTPSVCSYNRKVKPVLVLISYSSL